MIFAIMLGVDLKQSQRFLTSDELMHELKIAKSDFETIQKKLVDSQTNIEFIRQKLM